MVKIKVPATIGDIEVDAIIDKSKTLSASAPSYPVETGYSISDSIIIQPTTLDMTIMLSDMPITWRKLGHGGKGWTDRISTKLEELFFKKEPVTVIVNGTTYQNMAIVSLSISDSTDSISSRSIPISFQQIYITSSKTTTIPDSYGKAGLSAANAGTASTSKSDTPSGGAATDTAATSAASAASSESGSLANMSKETKGSLAFKLAKGAGLL